MNESISEIQRLLQKIVGHLEADTGPETRKTITKLLPIAAVASTMAFTLQTRR